MIKNLLEMWLLWRRNARLVRKVGTHGGLWPNPPQESKRAFKCLW